jgi:Lar family restriction alleviation protein
MTNSPEAQSKSVVKRLAAQKAEAKPRGVELLPCPFCGEQPVYLTDFEDDSGVETVHHVSCGLCSIQPGIYGEKSKDDAVRTWNTRIAAGQQLCAEHQKQFTLFEVGGCLVCWCCDTCADLPRVTADSDALWILQRAAGEPCHRADYGWAGTCATDGGHDGHYKCVSCLAKDFVAAPRAIGETTVEAWQPIETVPKDGTEVLLAPRKQSMD